MMQLLKFHETVKILCKFDVISMSFPYAEHHAKIQIMTLPNGADDCVIVFSYLARGRCTAAHSVDS